MEKIEILLATYNGQKYIEKQIESILNQEYENWINITSKECETLELQILDELVKQNKDKIKKWEWICHRAIFPLKNEAKWAEWV